MEDVFRKIADHIQNGQAGEALEFLEASFASGQKLSAETAESITDVLTALGIQYCGQGQQDQGIACFNFIIKWLPGKHQAYYNIGQAYASLSQNEEAIPFFRKAIGAKPDYVLPYRTLAFIYFNNQQYLPALEFFTQANRLDPDDVLYWKGLGACYLYLERPAEALPFLEKVMAAEPSDSYSMNFLGDAYRKLNMTRQAIPAYHEVINLNGGFAETWNALGTIYMSKQEYGRAIEYLNTAVKLKPDFAEFWYNLGSAFHLNKDHEEGIKYFEKALSLNPDVVAQANILNNWGDALTYVGTKEEALELFLRSAALNPAFPAPRANAADIYAQTGNLPKAFDLYSEAMAIDPDFSDAYLGLLQLPLGVNPDAFRHYLKWVSLMMDTDFGDGDRYILALRYAIKFRTPMLLRRLLARLPLEHWPSGDAISIREALKETSALAMLFFIWKAEGTPSKQALLSEAILRQLTGDSVESYRIFDEEIDDGSEELSMLAQYYYCRSAFGSMQDHQQVRHYAANSADALATSGGGGTEDRYYAALIFFENGDLHRAIDLLKHTGGSFLQAKYKLLDIYNVIIRTEITHLSDADKHQYITLKETAKSELQELRMSIELEESNNVLYKTGIKSVVPAHEPEQFLQDIRPVIYASEVLPVVSNVFFAPMEMADPVIDCIRLDDSNDPENSLRQQYGRISIELMIKQCDERVLEQLINRYKDVDDFQLGNIIHQGAITEAFYLEKKLKDYKPFEFREYLALNYYYYRQRIFTAEQAYHLMLYIYYCLLRLDINNENEITKFIREEISEKLIDLLDPTTSVNKIIKFAKALRSELSDKNSPIVQYDEFISVFEEDTPITDSQ